MYVKMFEKPKLGNYTFQNRQQMLPLAVNDTLHDRGNRTDRNNSSTSIAAFCRCRVKRNSNYHQLISVQNILWLISPIFAERIKTCKCNGSLIWPQMEMPFGWVMSVTLIIITILLLHNSNVDFYHMYLCRYL